MRLRILACAGLGLLAGLGGCVIADERVAYDGYRGGPYAYSSQDRYPHYYRPHADRPAPARWNYQRQTWTPSRWDSSAYDAHRRGHDRP